MSEYANQRHSSATERTTGAPVITKSREFLGKILLAAQLCNYGRGSCLIIIGREGKAFLVLARDAELNTEHSHAEI